MAHLIHGLLALLLCSGEAAEGRCLVQRQAIRWGSWGAWSDRRPLRLAEPLGVLFASSHRLSNEVGHVLRPVRSLRMPW